MKFVTAIIAFVIDLVTRCNLFTWFGALGLVLFLVLACFDVLGVIHRD